MAYCVENFVGTKCLVLGDLMLDRYLIGRAHRISPEAPVPVVSLVQETSSPGGAGHVALSLAGLGAEVTVAGAVGEDSEGKALEMLLQAGTTNLALRRSAALRTVCKTRVLADNFHQLLRIDQECPPTVWHEISSQVVEDALPLVRQHDVLVLGDYDKGALPADSLVRLISECHVCSIPCIIDPKKFDFASYRGATVLTPNLIEMERAVGHALPNEEMLSRAAAEMRVRLNLPYLLITRGAQGMLLAQESGIENFPAQVREVADVTGAGDTVVAVLAVCLGSGLAIRDACLLASLAAGIAVSKPMTYVVRRDELEAAQLQDLPKIADWEQAKLHVQRARRHGKKIVFTNGCFDILHAGHLHSLQAARKLGDYLIVGLNADISVRGLKGTHRPLIAEDQRAALMAGLACVDLVILFDELTPELLVRHLSPDVLANGGDDQQSPIAGADFVRACGGEVVLLPYREGLSTTQIVERIKAQNALPDHA